MRIIDHLRKRWRLFKKEKGLREEIARRGGEDVRLAMRRERQSKIKNQKAVIIQGLIRSWDIGEIRKPSREEYNTLMWFYHGLTINYLRELEKKYWD